MQVEEAYTIPLEEEWLDARDAGALADAVKTLIAELIGWGSPIRDHAPQVSASA